MQESAARRRVPDSGRAPQPPRRSKPVKKRNWKRFFTIVFLFFLLLGASAAGAVYWKLNSTLEGASSSQTEDGIMTVDPNLGTEYHSDEPVSMVILGRDTRKETGSMNTDVMMLAVVNPVSKKVTMLSIPRDTRVKIPGYRDYHKINSVYANGEAEKRQAERNGQKPEVNGITLTKQTLSEIFGIPVQYYVMVDFDGFKAVIDEVGGVEVNVDRRLVYDDPTDDTHINLQPGPQLLNGEQALGYVRHRHDNRGTKYYSSDFDRNQRQQEVIKAIVDKMTSLDGITKIFNVIEIGGQHVRTDLPPSKIKGIVYDFKGMNSSSVQSLENGAFWSGSSGYTFFPKDKMEEIRTTLQSEMGLQSASVSKLNDSVVLGDSGEERVASKPKPRKQTKTQTQPAETAKPVEPEPKAEEPQTETPPPDIVPPATTEPSTDNTEPVDPAAPPQTDNQSETPQNPPEEPPVDAVPPPEPPALSNTTTVPDENKPL